MADELERYVVATYAHPDGRDRHVYRSEHDGICEWKSCSKNVPHKHIWQSAGGGKGCYLLPWVNDRVENILVLVEGEKAAMALKSHVKSGTVKRFTPVSWMGGNGSASFVDFKLCEGRVVVLWPDNDSIGRKAMNQAEKKALDAGAKTVTTVFTDGDDGNDVADFPEKEVVEILQAAVAVHGIPFWDERYF